MYMPVNVVRPRAPGHLDHFGLPSTLEQFMMGHDRSFGTIRNLEKNVGWPCCALFSLSIFHFPDLGQYFHYASKRTVT